MTIILFIVGATMIYAWIHSIILIFTKKYSDRTLYEKVITIYGIVMLVLFIIGSLN